MCFITSIGLTDTLAQYVSVVQKIIDSASRADISPKRSSLAQADSSQAGGIVTAPSDAEDTALRYLASAPVALWGETGRFHASCVDPPVHHHSLTSKC